MAVAGTFDHIAPEEYDDNLYRVSAECKPINGFAAWGEEESRRYFEEGFVSVANAFDADTVQNSVDGLLHLMDHPQQGLQLQYESLAEKSVLDLPVDQRQDYVRKFMWFVDFDKRFRQIAYSPEMLAVVEKLLGAEPEMFQEMALFKPPGIGREKPWHQDHAYFNVSEGTKVVGVWIALDDATVENGCMIFKPGGHKEGPMAHFNRRDWQICDADAMAWNGNVAAPVPKGGVLIFDGLTPHGTPMNRSGSRRRAVQYHYVAKGTPRTTTEERIALFGEEGRNVSC